MTVRRAGRVVVVGAGRAGSQVAISLRDEGYQDEIVVLGDEGMLPYDRPPLSKGFLQGTVTAEQLPYRSAEEYQRADVDLKLDRPVRDIDLASRTAVLDDGALAFDHLVIATGASPRRLALRGAKREGVVVLRDVRDAVALRERLLGARRLLVIGGGYVGLEVAATARLSHQVEVTLLESQDRLLARSALPETSHAVAELHRGWGSRIEFAQTVLEIASAGTALAVRTRDAVHTADVVLMGVGAAPRVDLAERAGLPVSGGVVVDAALSAPFEGVWAIGDCSRFVSSWSDGSARLESVQNATDQARHVAASIASDDRSPYRAVPWFWSDQGASSFQSVGMLGSRDSTLVLRDSEAGATTVLAFEDQRLLGGDSIDAKGEHLALRRLLATGRPPDLAECSNPGFDLRAALRRAREGDRLAAG